MTAFSGLFQEECWCLGLHSERNRRAGYFGEGGARTPPPPDLIMSNTLKFLGVEASHGACCMCQALQLLIPTCIKTVVVVSKLFPR